MNADDNLNTRDLDAHVFVKLEGKNIKSVSFYLKNRQTRYHFVMEVVVTSECSGQLWNTCIWDPLTGTSLRTFRGGISGPQSLNIVGGDYLFSSLKDKPILQVYLKYY